MGAIDFPQRNFEVQSKNNVQRSCMTCEDMVYSK